MPKIKRGEFSVVTPTSTAAAISGSADSSSGISRPQTRVEALWRTLVADTFFDEHPAPAECGAQFYSHLSAFIDRAALREDLSAVFIARISQIAPASILPEPRLWRGQLLKLPHRAGKVKTNSWGDLSEDAACWIRLFDCKSRRPWDRTSAASVRDLELLLFGATEQVEGVGVAGHSADFLREANLTMGTARRLIRTNDKLIGVGPSDSRSGDEVWILAGASTPFVLRPLENGHKQLIGDAYIHGMMHGEVANLGLNVEEFILA